jgi:hypothetical protein
MANPASTTQLDEPQPPRFAKGGLGFWLSLLHASWCEAIHSATRHPHATCRLSLKLKHGGGNLVDGKFNDPRNPQLLTENLFSFPLWIPYARVPDDDWHIADVQVTVNPGPQQLQFISAAPLPLRLAQEFGEFCFLRSIRP